MKNLFVRFILIVGFACLSGRAMAGTESFASGSFVQGAGIGKPTSTIAIQGFNPSMGTLTQVTFSLDGTTQFTLKAASTGSLTVAYTDSSTFSLTLTAPTGQFLTLNPASGTLSGTAPSSGSLDTQSSLVPTTGFSLPITTNLNSFTSAGMVNFTIGTSNLVTQGSASGVSYNANDMFNGAVHVTYLFDAVPEPMALAYLPLAAGAFALLRLRRRA